MTQTFVIMMSTLFAGAAFSIILVFRIWRLRYATAGTAVLGLLLCSFFYSLGYALELASFDLPTILIFNKVQYLGIAFLPTFWILAAARISGTDSWLSRPVLGFFVLISTLTLLLDVTNPLHHLFYRSVRLDATLPHPVLRIEGGPWYWVQLGFSTAALLIGTVLLLGASRRQWGAYRRRSILLLAGSFIPWLGMLVYELGLSPYGLDTSPVALAASIPILAWVVFRYRVFDLAPVAKDRVFASMQEAALILDPSGRIVDFNPAALAVLPDLSVRSFGRTLEETAPGLVALHDFVKAGSAPHLDLRLAGGGGARVFRAKISPILSRRKRRLGRIILLTDITEQVRLMESLRELATKDDLTGAANRIHFRELAVNELARAKRYGRALSVLILDLDHFKDVNDTWGHEAGDTVLREVAGIFRSVLRTSDVLCRHGGEEFAILLPETGPSQAAVAAERLRAKLAATPIRLPGGAEVRVTASIGVEGVDRVVDQDLETLLRSADRAMYAAKAAGRNTLVLADRARAL